MRESCSKMQGLGAEVKKDPTKYGWIECVELMMMMVVWRGNFTQTMDCSSDAFGSASRRGKSLIARHPRSVRRAPVCIARLVCVWYLELLEIPLPFVYCCPAGYYHLRLPAACSVQNVNPVTQATSSASGVTKGTQRMCRPKVPPNAK